MFTNTLRKTAFPTKIFLERENNDIIDRLTVNKIRANLISKQTGKCLTIENCYAKISVTSAPEKIGV